MLTHRRRRLMACIVLIALAAAGGYWWWGRESVDQLLLQARMAAKKNDFAAAERLAGQVLAREPEHAQASILAAKAARANGRPQAALDHLARITGDASDAALEARLYTGDILLFDLKRPAEAEPHLRAALEVDPHNRFAIERMAFLLGHYGRGWESISYRLRLIQFHQFDSVLLPLAAGYSSVENPDDLLAAFEASPGDPLVQLGMSRYAFWKLDVDRSLELAHQAADQRPDLVEAHVRIGMVLVERRDDEALRRWHDGLPDDADDHPEIWSLRGRWALDLGQPDAAVRCFWEAIRRDAAHHQATYQLGRLLQQRGSSDEAARLLRHAELLTNYYNQAVLAMSSRNADDIVQAAKQAETLGLTWETYAWFQMAATIRPADRAARQAAAELVPQLERADLARIEAVNAPAAALDFSALPLLDTNGLTTDTRRSPESDLAVPITFSDDAEASGMQFTRIDFRITPGRARTIRETTGGGVAALDYDGDGWIDLYFTQSCPWPPSDNDTTDLDELFRNYGGASYRRVTASSEIIEQRYSQGGAVGDVNNDGFPDLFVANMGRNRLYENNGDGTFRDVSEQMHDDHAQWSTSAALADLNGDAWPDLYVVNYLTGDDVYDRICSDRVDPSGVCGPQLFPGAQDRLFVNRGDGTFADQTHAAGVTAEGKGLGIVAADLTGTQQLSLFVANDNVPNLFFLNSTATPGDPPAFVEQGLAAGLALDGDGLALACMGIAAGDADGNGRLDFYVTNFYQESNTLYLQQSDGSFTDGTRQTGLRTSSLPMLGFGTQFVDADLDGHLDLIVTNGHVHDETNRDIPHRMSPQFYRNAAGKFVEYSADTLGPFFEGKYLGRGMARLDWNRDGQDDVAISHTDGPAALVTNTSATENHFITLALRGVESSRDAIGTTVLITAGGRERMQQLTAGDGYHASNERRLTFGLGTSEHAEECLIRWPSGHVQRFENVAADGHYIAVEGRDELIALPNGP